ncbi:MAG: AzlD domain-containing protein [Rhizobiaceae bacterium]|nr:AzlD domain-containing protein [Rhizobiaceae bacterium]
MGDLSFNAYVADWWPFAFILLAGWLPTDIWRFIGVLSSGRLDETSPGIALTRTIATGMVAAVIARLVLYPTGTLALIPDTVRVGALAAGFAVYMVSGRRVLVGILAAEAILVGVPLAMAA